MPGDQLTRRDFVAAAFALSGAGAALEILGACAPSEALPPLAPTGRISGMVVDAFNAPQAALGTMYLMYPNGLQTGRRVAVNGEGRFAFEDVPAGDWQLRFHAPGIAYVSEELPHPVRLAVRAGETVDVRITVEHGWEDGGPMIEIYIGDFFFQEQPLGLQNGDVAVKVGTPICWYNVGLVQHRVVGGFWDSGTLEKTGSYIWVPDRTGVFPYYCSFHRTQMLATLRVTS